MESKGQVDLEGFSRKGARLLKTRVMLAEDRSFLSPSTPPYIGGGAEGFVIHKLQSSGDYLSPSRNSYKSIFLIQFYLSKPTLNWASGLHILRVMGLQ